MKYDDLSFNVFNAVRGPRKSDEDESDSIEDNLTRALLVTLKHVHEDGDGGLAAWTKAITNQAMDATKAADVGVASGLSTDLAKAVAALEAAESDDIEIGLQGMPRIQGDKLKKLTRVIVGIAGSRHRGKWTHDKRVWPESPRPDGYIYVKDKAIFLFESQTADHALDITQLTAYANKCLDLISESDAHPFPKVKKPLTGEAVDYYRKLLKPHVLEASWSDIVQVLTEQAETVSREETPVTAFLVDECRDFLSDNSLVPYAGVPSLFENALGRPSDRRKDQMLRGTRFPWTPDKPLSWRQGDQGDEPEEAAQA